MPEELAIRPETGLTPAEVVTGATIQSKLLMDIVEKTKCYQQIRDKKYLQVEAWETIGAFNRTHAETESVTPIIRDSETIGYQARVQLWKDGNVVGGAVMPCYFTENCCKGKEGDAKHKACMSAAQTFATSKAYRMNFSYVAILAGFQPTPAEEMGEEEPKQDKTQHWCIEHKTEFFMRGKMKTYAHPIGDTGEWCHEHKEDAQKPVAESKKPELFIDLDWLKESLEKLQWADVKGWLKDKFKIEITGKFSEVLGRLTPDQQREFASEVEERLTLK